jgi:hypothetical protein
MANVSKRPSPHLARIVSSGWSRDNGTFWYVLTVVSGQLPPGTPLTSTYAKRAFNYEGEINPVPAPDSYAHAVSRLAQWAKSNGWTIVDDASGTEQEAGAPVQTVPAAKVARIVESPPHKSSRAFWYTLCAVSGDRQPALEICHSMARPAPEPGPDGAVVPDPGERQRALDSLRLWPTRHGWTIEGEV